MLHETLKSRLLIPDYHRSDNSDKDLVNRKDVNDKVFNLYVLRGLDMKGNKVIHVEDPISAIVTISVKDTERKHNPTTLMAADGKRTRSNNITICHVIQKYLLI